jgi:hypothetical protein
MWIGGQTGMTKLRNFVNVPKKQRLLPNKSSTDWFFITMMKSIYCIVRTASLTKSLHIICKGLTEKRTLTKSSHSLCAQRFVTFSSFDF